MDVSARSARPRHARPGLRSKLPLLVLLACSGLLQLPATAAETPAKAAEERGTTTIYSVWNETLQCGGGLVGNEFGRHPDESAIKSSRRVDLPAIGYTFTVPHFPGMDEVVVKLSLDDTARGVTDHYLRLARQDLGVPFAAILVTELPEQLRNPVAALLVAADQQHALAAHAGARIQATEVEGPFGSGFEVTTRGRMGSPCFPTSSFALAPASGSRTLGISRFAFHRDNLLEFTLIVEIPAHVGEREEKAYARSAMEEFWQAFRPLKQPGGV